MTENAEQKQTGFLFVFTVIILSAVIVFFTVDSIRTRHYNDEPLFCLPLIQYESGCTDYFGLGYKIHKDFHPYDKTSEYTAGLWIFPDEWCI